MPQYRPHKKQVEAHNSLVKRKVLLWSRQVGKLIDIRTPIITPHGFVKLGDLKVGDTIYGPDGKPTKLTYITPTQYDKKTYEVEFSNGDMLTACADHLWTVKSSNWMKRVPGTDLRYPPYAKTLTTEQLIPEIKKSVRPYIEFTKPLEFPEKELPIDPYTLGVWLGDGTSRQAYVTCHKDDLPTYQEHISIEWARVPKPELAPDVHKFKIKDLQPLLKQHNLLRNKHIPEEYFIASYEQRLELLKGLMDTDGYVASRGNTCEFYQKNERLLDDVRTLLATLGIKSTKRFKTIKEQQYWTITFRPTMHIFKLPRKLSRQSFDNNHQKNAHLFIKDIRPVESVPMRCLQVDNESHLFLAGRTLIPTHNTVYSVNEAWIKAVQKQGRYMIIFPTYRQAKDTVWNQYLHYIPKQLIKDMNQSDLTITLHYMKGTMKMPDGTVIQVEHDESLPPSTIELKGSDNADLLRGMKAEGLIFDEYALQEPENWETVFQPMLATTGGWATFVSTPKGFNHFYDMVVDVENGKQGWWMSKATWRDNPAISREHIENIRREADDKGDLSGFMQEYELEFRSVEGAVYPEFKREVHVIKPSDVPHEGTVFGAIDFGWAEEHPTAFNLVKVDREGNWYIFDELQASKLQMREIADQIRQKTSGMSLTAVIGDSARPDYIDLLRNEGIPTIPAAKKPNSVATGIQLIGQLLHPRIQLLGEPKPKLFISSNCRHTVFEFEQYKYPSKKKDRPASEVPMKKDDHHMDGLRYLALHLKYGTIQDDKPIKQNLHFNEYGLL